MSINKTKLAKALGISRSSLYYQPKRETLDQEVKNQIEKGNLRFGEAWCTDFTYIKFKGRLEQTERLIKMKAAVINFVSQAYKVPNLEKIILFGSILEGDVNKKSIRCGVDLSLMR